VFGWDALGKFLRLAALLLLVLGGLLPPVGRVPFIGRLPGDIAIEREHFRLYVPLATCLLLGALLTLVMWLLGGRR